MSLKAKIEAVLFLTAKPIKAQAMARIVNADVQAVRQALLELVHDYEERQGGLEIADEDGYSFQVKDEFANLMNEFLPVEMSAALIRTLSAIAIKQPIAQSEIIRVRGAGAYEHIKELVNRELIAKREEPGGRSPMLSTTKKFQEYFRLTKDGKDLRNFLKRQVRKLNAAEQAAQAEGQLSIPEVVNSTEADNELNNRIFLETADMAEARETAEAAEFGESMDPAAAAAAEAGETPAHPGADESVATPAVEPTAPAIAQAALSEPHTAVAAGYSLLTESEPAVAQTAPLENFAPEAAGSKTAESMAAPPVSAESESADEVAATVETPAPAATTLSKLAAAANTTEPTPLEPADLPAAEDMSVPVESEETAASESGKSTVQAHSAKRSGPAMGNNKGQKKAPPAGLSDLLKKQKELEKVLKRAREEEAEQTLIDFAPPLNTDTNDKIRPS